MRFVVLVCLLILFYAAPVQAQSFEGCKKTEIAYATAAIDGARAISLRAAAMVGDTPEYGQWFGQFSKDNSEQVRATLKAIDRALQSDQLRAVCPSTGEDGCTRDVFANVWPDQPYVVNLCPSFFRMPSMLGVVRTSSAFDTGTREGTLIHEVSHFEIVGGTEDNCYGREVCTGMARRDAQRATDNADSYQYFAEDITFVSPLPAK